MKYSNKYYKEQFDKVKFQIKKEYLEGNSALSLSKKYKVTSKRVNRYLRSLNIHRGLGGNRKYKYNTTFFKEIKTEESAYFLGLLYADGWLQSNSYFIGLSLKQEDKLILEKLNKMIGSTRNLTFRNYNSINFKHSNQFELRINSKVIYTQLLQHGLYPNKSCTLQFPTTVPRNLMSHFIRGYFDGDGSIGVTKGNGVWFNIEGSEPFILNLQEYLKFLVPKLKLTKRNSAGCSITFKHGGKKNVLKLLNWIYKDATLYIERKYNIYNKIVTLCGNTKKKTSLIAGNSRR